MEIHKLVREILNTKKVWEMSGNFIISISLEINVNIKMSVHKTF